MTKGKHLRYYSHQSFQMEINILLMQRSDKQNYLYLNRQGFQPVVKMHTFSSLCVTPFFKGGWIVTNVQHGCRQATITSWESDFILLYGMTWKPRHPLPFLVSYVLQLDLHPLTSHIPPLMQCAQDDLEVPVMGPVM